MTRKKTPTSPPEVRPATLLPPSRVLVTVASLLAATALVRAGLLEPLVGSIVDIAVQNIISLILAFTALVSVLVWFVRESGQPAAMRWGLLGGIAAAVVAGVATLRVERVSGDMVPQFAWKWSPARDRLLPRAEQAGSADGDQAADGRGSGGAWKADDRADFPRFLGPRGDAGVDAIAIPATSGAFTELWRRPIGAGWGGFAVCDGHAVTLEQRGDEEVVGCYSLETGAPDWSVAVKARHETVLGGVGPRSTPTILDGVVYTTGATGWLHAIEGSTGKVAWRKNVLDDLGIDGDAHRGAVAWGRAGSPLVTKSLVIVPGGGPLADGGGAVSLAAYDRSTGDRVWTGGDEQIAYASPILARHADRDIVLMVNEASVAAHDPLDGRRLWSFPWPGHSNSDASCSQPHPLDGGRVFISKGYGIGSAVFEPAADASPLAFRPAWAEPGLLKTKFTNVAIHGGHAYGLSDGILECVRLSDGKRIWKGGRYGQGQVLRVGELLVVQAESGEVAIVDCSPQKLRERCRIAALDGQTWNNPCVTQGRLLVRNAEEAACYAFTEEDADESAGDKATVGSEASQ